MKQYVIIVAGGKGLRMGTELPKQFLVVGGKPVLMHTINAFHTYNPQMKIILFFRETRKIFELFIEKEGK